MPVHQIVDGMTVAPNNVYVIPPDHDLGILHGSLHLLEPPERRGLRHPIDAFFRSLALEQGDRAIGIVVSGTGTEGTVGLRDIKAAGGIVLVQNPETAKFNGMPQSAVSTGLADLILPIGEMPDNLIALVGQGRKLLPEHQPEPEDEATDLIKKILMLLRAKTGHDFYQYKRNTIIRRIDRRMSVHRLDRMKDYVRLLQQHPQELDILFKELLIGVTSYFRDSEAFAALRQTVIPAICDGRTANEEIRIWVPACSTGEEAVSIALLIHERLAETGQSAKVQVFATDIDSRAISIARRGVYPASIAVDVSPELLQRYFVLEEGGYCVCKLIRDSIVYAAQNMIKDPPFSRLDLISCRNVLIYMGSDLQKSNCPPTPSG
jgi:two-component system CheB/CheR fusion protein